LAALSVRTAVHTACKNSYYNNHQELSTVVLNKDEYIIPLKLCGTKPNLSEQEQMTAYTKSVTAYLDRIIISLLSTFVHLLWFPHQLRCALPISIYLYIITSLQPIICIHFCITTVT